MTRNNPLTILVVDDSDFFASMLAGKLESNFEMRTETATNASDAMAVLEATSVDCIVSDYEMPDVTGLDLYRMVDEEYDVPFVLLTGAGNEKVASRAVREGIDEYFLKQTVENESALERFVNRVRTVVDNHRTQQKYEQLIDNSPDAIAEITAEGEILAANEAMAMEFSTTQAELVGKQLSELLPAEIAADRLEESKRAITSGSAVTFQDSIGVRHFHNIAVPLSDGGGGDSIQLVTREITHQKQSEQVLEQKSQKLTLINRIVRHDIKNDVQLLRTWARLLEDHVDEEGLEYVERIDETSDHITELTSISRDFVESLQGDSEVALEPTNVASVLETEVEKKRESHGEATFVVGDLPRALVRANELLSSVFANLLSNAVRHNESESPEVHVDASETDTAVVVRISDNGPGVPDEKKETIFGKGTMGPESPGTGIGLYLVHTLVDQYGGAVWVEDNEPSGAVFVVELPKSATDEPSFAY